MHFHCHRLTFRLVARDPICFPEGASANLLRGSLGMHLAPDIFRPRRPGPGPSGLVDQPRPFVLRTRGLEGRLIEPGELFRFDVHLFTPDRSCAVEFIRAIAATAAEGIGTGRGRADRDPVSCDVQTVALDLTARATAPTRIRVLFLSPTELKHRDAIADRPEFPIVFNRIRDRVATLSAIYGPGPLPLDFAAIAARAGKIAMTHCALSHVKRSRRSSRTGQTHPLGGFIGTAEYEGALAEFLPWLEAARWTGVGRQAVWGKGEIAIEAL